MCVGGGSGVATRGGEGLRRPGEEVALGEGPDQGGNLKLGIWLLAGVDKEWVGVFHSGEGEERGGGGEEGGVPEGSGPSRGAHTGQEGDLTIPK
jgi:hypothetical protein